MLYSEDDKRKQESYRIPLFGSEEESTSIPKYVLKKGTDGTTYCVPTSERPVDG